MCWSEDCRWAREEVGQTQLLGEREKFSVYVALTQEMPPATAFAVLLYPRLEDVVWVHEVSKAVVGEGDVGEKEIGTKDRK